MEINKISTAGIPILSDRLKRSTLNISRKTCARQKAWAMVEALSSGTLDFDREYHECTATVRNDVSDKNGSCVRFGSEWMVLSTS
jgi:hypothetical protein